MADTHALCCTKYVSFRAHHENLNEDRAISIGIKNIAQRLYFLRYKVYLDIRGGYLGRGRQTTTTFSVFAGYFSETLEKALQR